MALRPQLLCHGPPAAIRARQFHLAAALASRKNAGGMAGPGLEGIGKFSSGLASSGTIVNPTKPLVEYLAKGAENMLTKAVVVVGTPQHAAQLARLAAEFPHIQTVAAAVDTVGLGWQRDGFSWMVFEHELKILDRIAHEPDNDRFWTMSQAALRINSSDGMDVAIPASNTLFTVGTQSAIYAGNDTPLAGLHVELPLTWKRWTSFRPVVPITEELIVTSAADNMLKTLSDKPAAQHLEESESLMNHEPGAKEREVFAEITARSGAAPTLVKVIAGGGGLWSARSRMLVLEPPCRPALGDSIRFFLSTGRDISSDAQSKLEAHTKSVESRENAVMLEVSAAQESIDERPLIKRGRNQFYPVFSAGSDQGFFVDDAKFSVPGESLVLEHRP